MIDKPVSLSICLSLVKIDNIIEHAQNTSGRNFKDKDVFVKSA